MLAPITNLFTRGLFGPVFQREVRVAGRRNSTYWVRGLYVLGLTALAALVYFAITADTRYSGTGRAESLQQLQSFAPTLGAFYVWFQFLTMCLLASTLTAGAICDERRKGSLSSLLTTPLSIFQIILGKLSGRLIQLVILIASGLPLLLAARIFGGISTHYILAALAITLCTSLLHASIALAASANARSSSAASAAGVVIGVVWCFTPMIGALIPPVSHSGRWSLLFLSLSPYFALEVETAKSLGFSIGLKGGMTWHFAAGYALFGTGLFLAIAYFRLKVLARTAGEPLPAKSSRKPVRKQQPPPPGSAYSAPLSAAGPAAVGSKPDPLTVGENPVLWRELRQQIFARPWHPRAGLLGIILLLVYIYSQAGWAEPVVLFVFSAILLALFFFQSTVIASSSVAGERESRSLEVLLTTPLSARAILVAKWLGALRRLLPVPVFYFSFVLVCGVLSGKFHWALLPHLLLIILPPACFIVATGIWLSVVTRRATVAAAVNILLALTLWIAIPLGGLAVAAILQPLMGSNLSREAMGPLLIFHPGAMTITALSGAGIDLWGSARDSRYESFLPFNFNTFSLAALGYAALYFALSWLILRLAARSLGSRTNRAH